MSIDSISIFPCVSIRQYSVDYVSIIIFRNVLHAHMFLIGSQLGVHTLKDKRRAKEKISYIRQKRANKLAILKLYV